MKAKQALTLVWDLCCNDVTRINLLDKNAVRIQPLDRHDFEQHVLEVSQDFHISRFQTIRIYLIRFRSNTITSPTQCFASF